MTGSILRDFTVAALFAALSAMALLYLIPAGIDAPESIENAALSPAFWPKVIAWTTLVSSLLLLVETYGARNVKSGPGDDPSEDTTQGAEYPMPVALLRILVVVGFLFLFYISLERYGLVIPSIVLLVVLMTFFGERKAFWIAVLSIGLPVILYVFFRYVAGVAIPLGIFG